MTLLLAGMMTALAQDLSTVGDIDEAGTVEFDAPTASAIINGEEMGVDDYPMAGAILMKMDLQLDGSAFSLYQGGCTGTLIAPDVVMLAAHCVDEFTLEYTIMYTFYQQGITDVRLTGLEFWWTPADDVTRWNGTRTPEEPEGTIKAIASIQHERFNINTMEMGTEGKNNDVALLFLEEADTETELAYLPSADEATQLVEGAVVTVVGWGQQGDRPTSAVGTKMGGDSVLGEIGDYEFQVGPDEDDVRKCHGDSGGPTFMEVTTNKASSLRVIGITSHSYDRTDCASKGGVDTRVDAYLDWIDEQMVSACDDGTRVWCDTPGIIEAPAAVARTDKDKDSKGGCSALSGSASVFLAASALLGAATRRRRQDA